jgi:phenylalanyl-tRNA synthetase beta chain
MKISYNWLCELTGLDWSPEDMGERLTLSGTACEEIEATDRHMKNVVVGQVTELKAIEGADKIRLATVDIGSETLSIICGSPNAAEGQKVAVATIGAVLAGGLKIKKAKIRGIESFGMICSERELGLSEDHAGTIVLPDDATVGTPLAEYYGYEDYMLTFELTPNRPDSTSAIGIARDLGALGGVAVKRPEFELKESSQAASDFIKIKIEDPDACPRYAARVIRNVKVGESPQWLKQKLVTAGMRPISNVVDISNFVMLEGGHPLHAFDLDRFGSDEVVVRRAHDKEKFKTLDGNEHELNDSVLMITNGKTGVAAGGVMGGLESEVEDSTTTLLLEAAYFNPSVIRKGRKVLGLSTDSSYRFERGVDPNNVERALNRAAFLLAELCGGEVCQGIVDCYPKPIEPLNVSFRPERCDSIIGKTITRERIQEIFEALDFEVTAGDPWQVTVPTFRPDIEREIDLIEEVARIEGWDSIADATTNIGPLFTKILPEDSFRSELRRVLTGVGFDEILGHGLADSKQATELNPDTPQVRLANSLSEELNIMRNSLLHTALDTVSHNLAHRNLDLCLFEIGKVYLPGKAGEFVEEERLSLIVSGNTPTTWRDKPRPLDFYDVSGALQAMAAHFRFKEISFPVGPRSFAQAGNSFDLMIDGTVVGWAGQVDGKKLSRFEIKQDVFAAEISLAPLMAAAIGVSFFKPLPVYPAAPRDLAIVVEESITAARIVSVVRKAAGHLAETVEVFDVYRGKPIDAGKKSIAIAISYRSPKGNLVGEEVDGYQAKVVASLKKNFMADIRDR